jgi:putative PIN family toxin of toxin-antitoxin system
MKVVLDTNVLIAAMRSKSGASAAILRAVEGGEVLVVCSPPLFLEYEQTMKRPEHLAAGGKSSAEVDDFLDRLSALLIPAPRSRRQRPRLPDPDDEMVIEAADFGEVDAIVTFETRTFVAYGRNTGKLILTPAEFLARLQS